MENIMIILIISLIIKEVLKIKVALLVEDKREQIEDADAPREKLIAIKCMANQATRELGIPVVQIKPVKARALAATYGVKLIVVNANSVDDVTLEVIRHECRHIWQYWHHFAFFFVISIFLRNKVYYPYYREALNIEEYDAFLYMKDGIGCPELFTWSNLCRIIIASFQGEESLNTLNLRLKRKHAIWSQKFRGKYKPFCVRKITIIERIKIWLINILL